MKKHTNTKTQNQTQLIEQSTQAKKAKQPGMAIRSRLKAGGFEAGGF